MEIKDAVDALSALAHETRLTVFRVLVRAGHEGLPAGEIAALLGVPNPTLSFHLNHLSQAGLLKTRRVGRSILYSVSFDGVRDLLEFLMEDCCQGRAELRGPRESASCRPRRRSGATEKT